MVTGKNLIKSLAAAGTLAGSVAVSAAPLTNDGMYAVGTPSALTVGGKTLNIVMRTEDRHGNTMNNGKKWFIFPRAEYEAIIPSGYKTVNKGNGIVEYRAPGNPNHVLNCSGAHCLTSFPDKLGKMLLFNDVRSQTACSTASSSASEYTANRVNFETALNLVDSLGLHDSTTGADVKNRALAEKWVKAGAQVSAEYLKKC